MEKIGKRKVIKFQNQHSAAFYREAVFHSFEHLEVKFKNPPFQSNFH